jgi:hypothetical protein
MLVRAVKDVIVWPIVNNGKWRRRRGYGIDGFPRRWKIAMVPRGVKGGEISRKLGSGFVEEDEDE